MTQEIKDRHGKLTESLNALVQSDAFKRQSSITQGNLFAERYNEFKDQGRAQTLRENEGLRRALRDKRVESQIQKLPPAKQEGVRQRLRVR